jgi:hypothetical protein
MMGGLKMGVRGTVTESTVGRCNRDFWSCLQLIILVLTSSFLMPPNYATAQLISTEPDFLNICITPNGDVIDCENPGSYDFGSIVLGESVMVTVAVTGHMISTVNDICFDNIPGFGCTPSPDSYRDFTLLNLPKFPHEFSLSPDPISFDIIFAPTALGPANAEIRIDSSDLTNPWYVQIRGIGVSEIPEPSTLVLLLTGMVGIAGNHRRGSRSNG